MFSRKSSALQVVGCAVLLISIHAVSGERWVLQAKPVCKPGTYSAPGTNCKPCPPQAMCLRLPLPCETMPTCDPVTGKATSMCWVKKAAGSPCSPEFYGDQQLPAKEQTHTCTADGQCLPKGTGAAAGTTNSSQPTPQQQQQQQQQPQKPSKPPSKCPSTPMCRRAQGPCDTAPACDPSTGRPTSMCWVPKPNGSPCKPSLSAASNLSSTAGNSSDAKFVCMDQQCVPAAAAKAGVAKKPESVAMKPESVDKKPESSSSNSSAAVQECNVPPPCTRIKGPCDLTPPCGIDGRPLGFCYDAKPVGSPCTPLSRSPIAVAPPPGNFYCNEDRACVKEVTTAAAGPAAAAAAGPAAAAAAAGPAAVKCPSMPLCRRTPGPCEMAPPCDESGRAISMCWVPKPEGAQCKPVGAAKGGQKYVCRNEECVPV